MPSPLPKIRLSDALAGAQRDTMILRGRQRERQRLVRTVRRATQHNLIVAGQRGVGKTALLRGFLRDVTHQKFASLRPLPYLQIDTQSLAVQLRDEQRREEVVSHIGTAFARLPACVLIIDEAQDLLSLLSEPWHFSVIFKQFLSSAEHHLILIITPEELNVFKDQQANTLKYFDILALSELSAPILRRILADRAPHLARQYQVQIEEKVLNDIVEQSGRSSDGVAEPRRVLHLFDEVCAAGAMQPGRKVTSEEAAFVAAQRQGIPTSRLTGAGKQKLRDLSERLAARVQGQDHVVAVIAQTIQRGVLGLKEARRPLGSFLFLGPSGVGKTEMARALAQEVYGSDKNMVRLDMSEFGEPHTVQRLLGAPPGYVGYEAGGQLTNPIQQRPFSLILLDEIEKAHSAAFDIFLQVLDDGRLTDGQGQTVDFSKTIIIATSNLGTEAILAQQPGTTGADFLKKILIPILQQRFRLEFINRFEHILTFNPLTPAALYQIAQLEIAKLEHRFAHHQVRITLSPEILEQKIAELYDPRFGARPLKRFIEQACETMLAARLLSV